MPLRPSMLALALLAALPAPALAADLALHCGQLFDAAAGRLRAEQTIVVSAGKVREVRAGLAAANAHARRPPMELPTSVARAMPRRSRVASINARLRASV